MVTFCFPCWQKALQNLGYDSVMELEADINRLTANIQRIKQKLSGVEVPPEEPEVREVTVSNVEVFHFLAGL